MKDYRNYFNKKMPDINFGIDIFLKSDLKSTQTFKTHWHEHMQIYYFISGKALLRCGTKEFTVAPHDIVIINSSELHYMESLSDDLRLYVIRINLPFLFSNQLDLCQTKFLVPLSQNRITFKNLIKNDAAVSKCVTKIIDEYSKKELGYELAEKSLIYQLIVNLLRNHINKIMSNDEFTSKVNNLHRFNSIIDYIEKNYNEKISVKELAQKANITVFYFCRIFKQITDKTLTDFTNDLRLEKSTEYLKENDLNITEIALKCGFENVNYYSRLFRRYYHMSPTQYRKSNNQKL